MTPSQLKALQIQDPVERGLVRFPVLSRESDRPLLLEMARKLLEGHEEAEKLRLGMQQLLSPGPRLSRKAVLAAAPLEGIDLTRENDPGREVDL